MLRRGTSFSTLRSARVARRHFGLFGCRRPVEDVFHFTPFVAARPSGFGFRSAPCNWTSCASPVTSADLFSNYATPAARIHEGESFAELELEVPRFRPADIHVEKNAREGLITVTGKRPSVASQPSPADRQRFSSRDLVLRDFFTNFVESATTSPTEFQRTFAVSPRRYDVEAATWTLEHGILSIKVPLAKAPVAVSIASDAKPTGTVAVVKTTADEFAAIAALPWPPAVQKTAAADGAVVYSIALPPAVTADHVSLDFDERAHTASLAVSCTFESAGKHRTRSESVTFATTLAAPQGTRADQVAAELKNGVLAVRFAAASPAADSAPK